VLFTCSRMASRSHESQMAGLKRSKRDLVTLGDYDIKPQLSAEQKLSPLDMNMPRLYGSRWVLCFPLPVSTTKTQVYVGFPLDMKIDTSDVFYPALRI
jgi:hypothetical protein